jgi:hypothetical protein
VGTGGGKQHFLKAEPSDEIIMDPPGERPVSRNLAPPDHLTDITDLPACQGWLVKWYRTIVPQPGEANGNHLHFSTVVGIKSILFKAEVKSGRIISPVR